MKAFYFCNRTAIKCLFLGKPFPLLNWFRNDVSLRNEIFHSLTPNNLSLQSELHLTQIRPDDHNAVLKCLSSNDNRTFLSSQIRLKVNSMQLHWPILLTLICIIICVCFSNAFVAWPNFFQLINNNNNNNPTTAHDSQTEPSRSCAGEHVAVSVSAGWHWSKLPLS